MKSQNSRKMLKKLLTRMSLWYSKEPLFTENQFLERIENQFIEKSTGILHIGAHIGQEASRYSKFLKPVIFIEANPEIFVELDKNIQIYENQKSLCVLLGDCDIDEVDFHVASNAGASSSIYKFGRNLGFSGLRMNRRIKLNMRRLDSIFKQNEISTFQHWVIDVQGAELKVLVGAGTLLQYCKSLSIEISEREVYEGGVMFDELNSYLDGQGFMPIWLPRKEVHQNILYIRKCPLCWI